MLSFKRNAFQSIKGPGQEKFFLVANAIVHGFYSQNVICEKKKKSELTSGKKFTYESGQKS